MKRESAPLLRWGRAETTRSCQWVAEAHHLGRQGERREETIDWSRRIIKPTTSDEGDATASRTRHRPVFVV